MENTVSALTSQDNEKRKNEKILKKIEEFFYQLPLEWTEAVYDKWAVNAAQKKDLKKKKTQEEKLKLVMGHQNLEVKENILLSLLEHAYDHEKNRMSYAVTSLEYETVMESYDEENFLRNTLLLLKRCSIDESFRNEHLSSFLDSQLFLVIAAPKMKNRKTELQKLIKAKQFQKDRYSLETPVEVPAKKTKKSAGKLTETVSQTQRVQEILETLEQPVAESVPPRSENKTEPKNTDRRIRLYGRINLSGSFYNFAPQYKEENSEIVAISESELNEKYPPNKAFNISYQNETEEEALRKLKVFDDATKSMEGGFYLIDLKESNLKENNSKDYNRKIDLSDFVGERLFRSPLRPVQEANFYRAVTPVTSITTLETFSEAIPIVEQEGYEGEEVVLLQDDRLYGIFEVYQNESGKYIRRKSKNFKDYLLDYHEKSKCRCLECDIQFKFHKDPIPVYFYKFNADSQKMDIMPDSVLLESLKDKATLNMILNDPGKFAQRYANSPFLQKFPDDIRHNRVNRVINLVTEFTKYQETITEIVKNEKIYQEQEKKIKQYDALQAELNTVRQELVTCQEQLEERERIASRERLEELERMERELEGYKQKAASYEMIENLETAQQTLQENIADLEQQKQQLARENETLRNEVQSAITEGFSHKADKAFDPYISHSLLEAAAQWDKTDEQEKLHRYTEQIQKQYATGLTGKALMQTLVERVQAKRNYDVNAILNIFITITQNFMTVFAGEPGVGKTSICDIIADALGMNSFEDMEQGGSLNRYIPVSVERGWQSKRDFIGYFNPLTRKYDRSNSKVYDAIRILDTERKDSRYPMLILLDEANLSPMEYYWADFMRLADKPELNNRFINIGTDSEIYIPETLHFLATINTDQTTEQLSPRLIDRACVIKLPSVALKEAIPETTSSKYAPVPWQNLVDIFDTHSSNTSPCDAVKEEIYQLFQQEHIYVSPRIRLHIDRYILTAQELMEDTGNVHSYEQALDYAVIQKLLPKINGNYESYRTLFRELKKISEANHLHMTWHAVEMMEKFQEENMGYCQYLS